MILSSFADVVTTNWKRTGNCTFWIVPYGKRLIALFRYVQSLKKNKGYNEIMHYERKFKTFFIIFTPNIQRFGNGMDHWQRDDFHMHINQHFRFK